MLKSFTDLKSKLRAEAKSEFETDLYKPILRSSETKWRLLKNVCRMNLLSIKKEQSTYYHHHIINTIIHTMKYGWFLQK